MTTHHPRTSKGWQPLLRRADQGCLGGVVAVSLLAIAGYCAWQWREQRGLIDIEKVEKRTLTFQVDINRADWPELTLLPGVGEVLAKSIVESRETRGEFRSHDDLRRVKGIGKKTLDKIRPYLVPIANPNEFAGN